MAEADRRILVLDGATGTTPQGMSLTAADSGDPKLEGCNENLILTRPDVITRVHETFLETGCDIVEMNTFGATPLVLAEYGLQGKWYEINIRSVIRLAPTSKARSCSSNS